MPRIRNAAAAGLAAASIGLFAGSLAAPASADEVHYWTTCDSTSQYANLHAQDFIRTLPLHREVGYNGNSADGWSMVQAYGAPDPDWGYVLSSCIAPDPRY